MKNPRRKKKKKKEKIRDNTLPEHRKHKIENENKTQEEKEAKKKYIRDNMRCSQAFKKMSPVLQRKTVLTTKAPKEGKYAHSARQRRRTLRGSCP